MLWITWSLAMLGASTDDDAVGPAQASMAVEVRGCQWQATSANFAVRNYHASHDARRVAEHCERWRTKLQKYWIAAEQKPWVNKCDVVVHSGLSSYLAAVGAGARQTFGSSLIKFNSDKQVARRLIDFRGDQAHGLAAVPHEMTHIIVADLLDGRQPPRWADEGMAILADTHAKQMLHERDLTQGITSRAAFRVAELLTFESYPQPSRIPAFYGQSASLTACLAKRDDPSRFVEFLRRSLDDGYDKALRDVYHLDNVAQLEQLWHEQRLALSTANAGSGYHGVRLALDDASADLALRAQ
ncbi:MAG TPA: hypothetical protein VKH44_03310 [Pirellulaceae bacterium]|nr:hypothetical protein [Pirellulaceae bacterium]